MAIFKQDREQLEESEHNCEIDDEFRNSYTRLGTRLNMQRVPYNFLKNLSILQKALIAILLTTAAICVGVLVIERKSHDKIDVSKSQYPGTCEPPSDVKNCGRRRDGFVKDPEDGTKRNYANKKASLIISSEVGIRRFSLDGLNTSQMLQNNDNVVATDYDFRTNKIFWSSYSTHSIYTAAINGKAKRQITLHDYSSYIYGVAVDWIHEHLYWVDQGRSEICVSNFHGTMKKVLSNDGFSWPFSIAVNPLNGLMYWSDRGTHSIERAGLDGSRREVILNTNITSPHGLVVDFEDSRLYWSQGKNPSSIWSCEFDGSDPKLIFTANPSLFSSNEIVRIATHNKFVYFIEWYSRTVYKVNKWSGEELALVYKSDSNLRDIKIYEATRQFERENLCSKRIGRCSHFCFLVPSSGHGSALTTTCACPDGFLLSADQKNCALELNILGSEETTETWIHDSHETHQIIKKRFS